MEAFQKCVCDHSLANPDAMRATLNLIRPQDHPRRPRTCALWVIKTTKEKCKHIFISTDFELTQTIISRCSLLRSLL